MPIRGIGCITLVLVLVLVSGFFGYKALYAAAKTLGYDVGYSRGVEAGYTSGKAEATEALTFRLGKDMLVKPVASASFDCDDSALYMYQYFTSLGYEVRIVRGNLDMENETWFQCNHVWVWVKSGGSYYPYDWGCYCTDEQYHEAAYPISYKDLLTSCLADY